MGNNSDGEILCVRIFRKFQRNLLICLVYRPPNGSFINFLNNVRVVVDKVHNKSMDDL